MAQYRAITVWPKQYHTDHGVYPTWREIAEKFPIAGEAIFRAAGILLDL